jgi:hypothetical protein
LRGYIKNTRSPHYEDADWDGLEALISVMILCSVFKVGCESLAALFSADFTGRPISLGVMSVKGCEILLAFSPICEERKKSDPAAAVSSIFSIFISHYQEVFSVGACPCGDETVIPCRSLCV